MQQLCNSPVIFWLFFRGERLSAYLPVGQSCEDYRDD